MEPIEMNSLSNPLNMPPNSHNAREQASQEAPKVSKVKVKTPWYRKASNALFAEDSTSVKSFIVRDIIIPTIKDTIYSIIVDGLAMAMYSNTKANPRRRVSGGEGRPKVAYGSYFSGGEQPSSKRSAAIESGRMDYRDFVFSSSKDAHEALDDLCERMKFYDGVVSVADYYDIVERTPPKQAFYWGWLDLSEAAVLPSRGDWIIELPRPVPLDDRQIRRM
jgi:hypothetical protein